MSRFDEAGRWRAVPACGAEGVPKSAIIPAPLLHREAHAFRAAASPTTHPLLDHCLLAGRTCHIEHGPEVALGVRISSARGNGARPRMPVAIDPKEETNQGPQPAGRA
jgi:hypothetical protein